MKHNRMMYSSSAGNRKGLTTIAMILTLILTLALMATIKTRAQDSSPEELWPAQVGSMYDHTLQAQGGVTPLTWNIVSGSLPHNVPLTAKGQLIGVPDTARLEPYVFTVEVTDSSPTPQKFQMRLSISVRSSMYIVRPSQIAAAGP